MATGVFENLAELCTGPHKVNQKKTYSFIFDRYTGFLKRYCRDHDSEFYRTKLALFEFFMTLIEGLDPIIISYQVTNLELSILSTIMINSLKQAYYCVVKKDPFDKKWMSDYVLKMEDFEEIMDAFNSNEKFSKHTLIYISLKIFTYIKTMGEARSKYDIFCKERDELLLLLEKKKQISYKIINEEDLLTYRFVKSVLIGIEIKLDSTDEEKNDENSNKLTRFYFPRMSSSFFLSETSKEKFQKNVDRSSVESKLSGFINYINYFDMEMGINQARFKNHLRAYKILSSDLFYYLETLAILISIINNLILLIT